MAVIINFWKGKLGNTIYDAIYLDIGHVSMEVINDKNPKDKIYISHHPKVKNSSASWQSIINDSFIPREKITSFKKDCDRQESKPDKKIVIYGLNESRIRKFYQKYLNNNLSQKITKYHFVKNNCCTVIAYFICKGLNCSQNSTFCSAYRYQKDLSSKENSSIEKWLVALSDKFWSPRSLKSFVKKVKKKTEKKSSVKSLDVSKKSLLLSSSF